MAHGSIPYPFPDRPDLKRNRPRAGHCAAIVGAALSWPVMVWWLIGNVPGVPAADDPDYVVRPPNINPLVESAVGIAATTVFAALILVLAVATGKRRLPWSWWPIILLLLVPGLVVAAGERTMTAPTIGANIGFGGMLLFGLPAAVVAVVFAAQWADNLKQGLRLTGGRSRHESS